MVQKLQEPTWVGNPHTVKNEDDYRP